MRIVLIFLALVPFALMSAIFLDGWEMAWFESLRVSLEAAFGFSFPHPSHRLYYLSKLAGLSSLWLFVAAFWITPLRTFVRFDFVPFKKLLGGFAVGYAFLHLGLFFASHGFSPALLSRLSVTHPFLIAGMAALVVLALAPWIKAWYRLIYLGIVLIIIHLLTGYRVLGLEHILAISLLTTALALRLVKR
ncbi:MAG: hypothetical protein M0P91_01040 [Sulfuricurvum sp.]|jgi:hypothetical protein|uniref:hypothetical protein n=1 Tax=Sulfuricurvum sp. TaxID=2025608 RepID=UPI0025E0C2CF|nr:hypothetical protein [Sulfuricurvum sp.]MCK9371754.1 hypothetical protein [Sulfuricurvum sp.]